MNAQSAVIAGLALLGATLGGGAHARSCPETAMGNLVCVSQIGDLNQVVVDQREAVASRVSLSMEGSDNGAGARVVQSGAGQAASVEITGSSNSFEIIQAGTGGSATQAIIGDGNAAAIHQSGGAGNVASELQAGAQNYAWARQQGSNNFAELRQLGSGNTIQLVQQGGDNHATLTQTDDGHAISLHQPGSTTATIFQSGAPKAIGLTQTPGAAPIIIVQSGGF